ncbi:GTP cyclohydrolase II [Roseinatronobacter sp. NSM]|uniref:GTP cyclohydrolase II n=1 Tax=Roseinatronobacter sp. NSM TaxID=3457785 RepID=UPI0040369199
MTYPVAITSAKTASGLELDVGELVARLVCDARLGLPVIMGSDTQIAVLAPVETLRPERFARLGALGAPHMVLSPRRFSALFPNAAVTGQAGTLAFAAGTRLDALRQIAGGAHAANPALPVGAMQAHCPAPLSAAALALAKAAQLLPAMLLWPVSVTTRDALRAQGLAYLPARDVLDELASAQRLAAVSSAALPMACSAAGSVQVFRPDNAGAEHYAITVGSVAPAQPVLTRLHSACFTGDVLGSLKCDCGPQLQAALAAMAQAGGGVLVYLNQEGRGIGLANKMRAYALQDGGLDTVQANHQLGFEDDERDFRLGAAVLSSMGIGRVRLLTNNPAKMHSLAGHGIEVVERVPLQVGQTPQNAHYLATKALKSGHILP